ncbi:hypothetical protein Patl1_00996 [Pistacia atlantica]|uniref:Uncharacterized protein n=1 Tax=Pistacia atlantica TaxID=434234 RepID=A0ACC1C820_9ROSI|nr:hypothetical protein Patl1_00996 [Pistacia atlantica]
MGLMEEREEEDDMGTIHLVKEGEEEDDDLGIIHLVEEGEEEDDEQQEIKKMEVEIHPNDKMVVKYQEEYIRNARGVQLFTCKWLPFSSAKAVVFLCHGYGMECGGFMRGNKYY